MKNIYLVLGLLLGSTSIAFAQDRNDFTGPEYKNYKIWEYETTASVIAVETNKEQVTGPEYKNQKAWERSDSDKTYAGIVIGSERSKLKGPAYKNYKPWRDNK